jgi:hypothetical protein
MSETTLTALEFELKIKNDQKFTAEKIFASLEQRFALLGELKTLTMRLSIANAALMMESMVTQFDTEELSDDDQISYIGDGSTAYRTVDDQVTAVFKIANEMTQVRRDLCTQENHLSSLLRQIGRLNAKVNGEGREYDALIAGTVYTLTVADSAASLKVRE